MFNTLLAYLPWVANFCSLFSVMVLFFFFFRRLDQQPQAFKTLRGEFLTVTLVFLCYICLLLLAGEGMVRMDVGESNPAEPAIGPTIRHTAYRTGVAVVAAMHTGQFARFAMDYYYWKQEKILLEGKLEITLREREEWLARYAELKANYDDRKYDCFSEEFYYPDLDLESASQILIELFGNTWEPLVDHFDLVQEFGKIPLTIIDIQVLCAVIFGLGLSLGWHFAIWYYVPQDEADKRRWEEEQKKPFLDLKGGPAEPWQLKP